MWEILSEGMLGFIVMVDSTRPETFREARSILETFRAYAPTPYVVAANKQDMEDAWDLECDVAMSAAGECWILAPEDEDVFGEEPSDGDKHGCDCGEGDPLQE